MTKIIKCPIPGERCNLYMRLNGSFIPDGLARYEGLPERAKWLWGRLYRYAGKDGQCYPTAKTLAADLGCSERTIHRHIGWLVERKFIKVEKLGGYQNRNRYVMLYHECFDGDWKDSAGEDRRGDILGDVDKGVRFEGLEHDRCNVINPDNPDRMIATGASYKEVQERGSKKEDHHYGQGLRHADFGKVLGEIHRHGGGGSFGSISDEDREYIDLYLEYHAGAIESPARYRRSLERKAMRGELDKSDWVELKGKKESSRKAVAAVKEERKDREKNRLQVEGFQMGREKIFQMLDAGEITEEQLRVYAAEGKEFMGIKGKGINVILKMRTKRYFKI